MSSPPVCSGSSLGLLVRQVRDAMRARWQHELVKVGHDLTFSQFLIIKKLSEGVANATELARIAELTPGAMTRLLDRLEARGLIVRGADPGDRRALNIRLTEGGKQIARDIAQCGERVSEAAFAGLDEAQRAQFVRLLEQVRDNLSIPET
ncbi:MULTISPECIES: MarR family winged helix-turn-helix transcriptional regulator [Pseudoxanthomonas]|uniref:DNA-binding MarR family transcriptional regulator n=1 Tax=Pseudoxanthomonas taiwanensis J19 TaxID=935569 RepID=A0A562DIJ6_9GAMM|nr:MULTISPECIES: MarR family transcriptional regulator [Pseudoxanthomonas]RRN80517.1 MarR family transcriptional regulator [Pseudoxanthomonas sp. SGD-10]TWH09480.1 DNA-binding MarR family transcriptional regulator [Pseudoxanthomonas taiwanensis J19]